MLKQRQFLAAPAVLRLLVMVSPPLAAKDDIDDFVRFNMVVSGGAKRACRMRAVPCGFRPPGPWRLMDVTVQGLPPSRSSRCFFQYESINPAALLQRLALMMPVRPNILLSCFQARAKSEIKVGQIKSS
jgi:hypothetical protein